MDNLKLGIEYYSTLNLTPNPSPAEKGAFFSPKSSPLNRRGVEGEVLRRIMFGHKNF